MNTLPHLIERTQRTFPGLREWAKLPGLVGWVAISAGVAAGYYVLVPFTFSSILYNGVLLSAIILSVCAGMCCGRPWVRAAAFFTAGIAVVSLCANQQRDEFSRVRPLLGNDAHHCMLAGDVVTSPVLSNGSFVFQVHCDSIFGNGARGAMTNKTIECRSITNPGCAGKVTLAGKYVPPRPAANPGAFDDFLYCLSNGIWGRFYCDSIPGCCEKKGPWHAITLFARNTVLRAASTMDNLDNRAIVVASFLNDRTDLSAGMKNLFLTAGIYHLLALSGFNVAILTGALFAFLLLVPVPRAAKTIFAIICIWAYLAFIGPIPSLFRAVIMTTVVLISFLVQRKTRVLNSLGIAGTTWLLLSPLSLLTPGYQLSFGATAGIAALYPVFRALWRDAGNFAFKKVLSIPAEPLFVSIAAFLPTAPVLVHHFGTLFAAGILVNVFAAALMSISMWISLVGFFTQIVFPPLVPVIMAGAQLCIDVMIGCAGVIPGAQMSASGVPRFLPAVFLLYGVFLAGLCALARGLMMRYVIIAGGLFVVCATILVAFQTFDAPPQVVLFDVKKSTLAAILWPDHTVTLLGIGGKGMKPDVYDRVVEPWMRQTPGSMITTVVPGDDPCNTVQAMEPALKANKVKTIAIPGCFDTSCSDFAAFAGEYKARSTIVRFPWCFSPVQGCSLSLLDAGTGFPAKRRPRFRVTIAGVSLCTDDPVFQPSDSKGATIITFRRNSPPEITSAIPAWHPLVALK